MRILVLGAGFGGLELTTTLADEFGADADIVLIDKADGFVFGRAMPPSAEMISPVTNRAASDARNTTTSAMSSATAHRPSGVCASIPSTTPATVLLRAHNAVSTTPGATALTRIPAAPNSIASERVAASSAPFEAA